MSKETTIARELGVRPLNAQSSSIGQRAARVTQKTMNSIRDNFNENDATDKYIEDLSYNRGTVTAYTIEKGYGDRPAYQKEYTSAPDRDKIGRGWTDRDAFAEKMFKILKRSGVNVKRFVHYGQYD